MVGGLDPETRNPFKGVLRTRGWGCEDLKPSVGSRFFPSGFGLTIGIQGLRM